MAGITDNQKIFVSEYLKDRNATRAYHEAFPTAKINTCRTNGSLLLKMDHIKSRIETKLNQLMAKNELTAERILREDGNIAFSDLTVMFPDIVFPDDLKPAIKSIEIDEQSVATTDEKTIVNRKVKIGLWNKSQSLDRLGKYLGIYTDKLIVDDLEGLEARMVAGNRRVDEAKKKEKRSAEA